MKIRVVLADTDECYISHFMKAIKLFFPNEIDLVAFSQLDSLQKYIDTNVFDVLLLSVTFPEVKTIRGMRIYLVNTKGIKKIEGTPAFCKYQKIDYIYKSILNTLAEEKRDITYSEGSDMMTKVIGFTAAAGGTGKTTVALSYSRMLAAKGFSVLYLPLECFSPLNIYFHDEGDLTMSNVLFAVKCKKGNLQLKIESALRQVYGGVYYLAPPKNPMEITEMNEEEWKELLGAVKSMGKFHAVVMDLPDMLNGITQSVLKSVEKLILVTDEKDVTIAKTQILLDCYRQLDIAQKTNICGKMMAVQNRSQGPRREIGIPVICQLPLITAFQTELQLIDKIVNQSGGESLLTIYLPGGEGNV